MFRLASRNKEMFTNAHITLMHCVFGSIDCLGTASTYSITGHAIAAMASTRRMSDANRRRIELMDQEIAENASIEALMAVCRESFGLAAKLMSEVKRGKFQKMDQTEVEPKACQQN